MYIHVKYRRVYEMHCALLVICKELSIEHAHMFLQSTQADNQLIDRV